MYDDVKTTKKKCACLYKRLMTEQNKIDKAAKGIEGMIDEIRAVAESSEKRFTNKIVSSAANELEEKAKEIKALNYDVNDAAADIGDEGN